METILQKDSDWSALDGEICRVLEFIPMHAEVKDGHVKSSNPNITYASVIIESPRIQGKAKGFITHKVDLAMLWAAFNERTEVKGTRVKHAYDPNGSPAFVAKHGVATDEEVWIVWTKNNYNLRGGLMSKFLPKLIVMVSPKGAYELLTNRNLKPELKGEARYYAERPLVTWTPRLMRK